MRKKNVEEFKKKERGEQMLEPLILAVVLYNAYILTKILKKNLKI
jgi:hypothetical protein